MKLSGPAAVASCLIPILCLAACSGSPRKDRTRPKPDAALPSGHWTGAAMMAGVDTVPIEIDLGLLESRWVGQYDAADYGVQDYPLEVTVDSLVTLRFGGVEADFQGRAAGDSLVGTLVFHGQSGPMSLVRKGAPEFSPGFLALESAAEGAPAPRPLAADARELRERFNEDKDQPRLLLLLSPS